MTGSLAATVPKVCVTVRPAGGRRTARRAVGVDVVGVVAPVGAVRVRRVGVRERRQQRGVRRELVLGGGRPAVERVLGEHLARVEHRAVPEAAELVAPHGERPCLSRRRERDVVLTRICVCFHAQLIGPEVVDDVERRDVKGDRRAHREHELVGLEPAERGVAVRPLPLLADHLDLQHVVRRRRPKRRRTLASAGALWLDQFVGAEAREKQHDDRRDRDPAHLDRRIATRALAANGLGATL